MAVSNPASLTSVIAEFASESITLDNGSNWKAGFDMINDKYEDVNLVLFIAHSNPILPIDNDISGNVNLGLISANVLKNKSVKVVGIAVENEDIVDSVELISSNPSIQYSFVIDDFNDIKVKIKKILRKICNIV